MYLEDTVAGAFLHKLVDELLAGGRVIGEFFGALVEAHAFFTRDLTESRVFGVHPDLVAAGLPEATSCMTPMDTHEPR